MRFARRLSKIRRATANLAASIANAFTARGAPAAIFAPRLAFAALEVGFASITLHRQMFLKIALYSAA